MAAPSESFGMSKFYKPTLDDVCFRYIPLAGGASGLAFSLNIMNPRLFSRMVSPNEVTVANYLWFNSHVGVGLYLFSRKHMKQAKMPKRIVYSIFGSILFNFGTLLIWATTRSFLPKNPALRSLFGLGSGVALLYIGRDYLAFVDSRVGNMLK